MKGLLGRQGEVRALVSDATAAPALKERGVKVAVGDLSDASLLGMAGRSAFSAVLVAEAAFDGRQFAFARDSSALFANWAEGLEEAGVRRVIWVRDRRAGAGEKEIAPRVPEWAVVETEDRPPAEVAQEVSVLDELAELE